MTDDSVIAALKAALDKDPRNGALWLHYADLLGTAGRTEEALAALRSACAIADVRGQATLRLVRKLREAGQLAEALIRAESALENGDDADLRAELDRVVSERECGVPTEQTRPAAASIDEAADEDPDEWARQFDWGDLHVTLEDVVGLSEVKRQINLRIIAPFKQPEVYEAFARDGGGGILLYGPPGCGKTFVARATAGELGARFVSVSIHEVVDKYYGESEKLIHALFEDARKNSPTVLFFDEFDALGSRRGGGSSAFWKSMVDQLLQEMDGIRGKNRDVLLIAATNMPWAVDSAFRRPGRFDRVLFVPPPDNDARLELMRRKARKLPGGDAVDLRPIAKATNLFTGADVEALCDRAAEQALEESLSSGSVVPVGQDDFKRAVEQSNSTAMEWIVQARNHARYANEGGHYDDVVAFLKKIKRW